MITEREVQTAIDECLKEPVTGGKRSALAELLIIQDYLFGEPRPEPMMREEPPMRYSESAGNEITTNGGSEFLEAVDGRNADKVWNVINELVEATKVLHPRMYQSFIDKIYDI